MATIPLTPTNGAGLCLSQSALKPGDIIVSTTNALPSGVIRSMTRSSVSHASLYAGGGTVIEAIAESGVVERSLAKAVHASRLAVVYRYPKLGDGRAAAVVATARKYARQGAEYDFGGAAGGGVRSNSQVCLVLMPVPAIGTLLSLGCAALGTGIANTSSKFYCSELILKAFSDAGVALTRVKPGVSTPEDLVTAYVRGTLQYMGHLKS